jgi:hypothetical protein
MRLPRLAALSVAALLLIPVAACSEGSTGTSNAAPVAIGDAEEEDDLLCSLQLTPEQTAELQQYVDQAPDRTAQDVESVCVLDEQGAVSYYDEDDNFADYWLYAMLFRRAANGILTLGVVSGDLDLAEYMLLSVLVGIDDDPDGNGHGKPYRLFAQANGQWQRQPNDTLALDRPQSVRTIRYGNAAPEPFAAAVASTSAGYNRFTVPSPPDSGHSTSHRSTTPSRAATPTPSRTTASAPRTTASAPRTTASSSRSTASRDSGNSGSTRSSRPRR